MANDRPVVRQSDSYKQFVNNHGVDVAGRVRQYVENMASKGWDIMDAVETMTAVRQMAKMLVISNDQADELVAMINYAFNK
jgi:hypothetical protein